MRVLVEQALEKAAKYETEGNTERAMYFLGLAEKADKIYEQEKDRKFVKEVPYGKSY